MDIGIESRQGLNDTATGAEVDAIVPQYVLDTLPRFPESHRARALEVYCDTIALLPESRRESAWQIYTGNVFLATRVVRHEVLLTTPSNGREAWGPTLDKWVPPSRPE